MPATRTPAPRPARPAFTLIELLVVISIIALLIGILLPVLGSSREEARAIACGSNLRQITIAFETYIADNKEFYPPAYVYPENAWNGAGNGSFQWRLATQFGTGGGTGYAHWSYFLVNNSVIDENAFSCPTMENGGHPATNPFPDAEHPDQNPGGGSGIDRQAKYMAYAGSEAIIPRNKFAPTNVTPNRLVRASEVINGSDTISATEMIDSFSAISTGGGGGGGGISKSHRSIQPFWNPGNTGQASTWVSPNFTTYVDPASLRTYPDALAAAGTIETTPLDAVGRHHASIDKEQGGTANFAFVDGHVERATVQDTLTNFQWGERFYGLSGAPAVNRSFNGY
jgi:prepilin-type N-terminal cleavage/methylation domain-containing protein/prepilin-type processing-associated H-X9-DG protein